MSSDDFEENLDHFFFGQNLVQFALFMYTLVGYRSNKLVHEKGTGGGQRKAHS